MPDWVQDHDLWNKAKKIAEEEGHKDDYAYVTGVYKKMGGKIKNSEKIHKLYTEIVTPLPEEQADPEQLKMGIEVEMEHTDNPEEAKKIALQHLAEVPDYYTKLKKVEEKMNKLDTLYESFCKKEAKVLSHWRGGDTLNDIVAEFPGKEREVKDKIKQLFNRGVIEESLPILNKLHESVCKKERFKKYDIDVVDSQKASKDLIKIGAKIVKKTPTSIVFSIDDTKNSVLKKWLDNNGYDEPLSFYVIESVCKEAFTKQKIMKGLGVTSLFGPEEELTDDILSSNPKSLPELIDVIMDSTGWTRRDATDVAKDIWKNR